jgi:hypothetical protein
MGTEPRIDRQGRMAYSFVAVLLRGHQSACRESLAGPLAAYLWPVLFGSCGLVLAHHETVLTGFALTQFDLGDTRLNHFMLEHGYRWVIGARGHESLFSPGFFFPTKNVAAYSDVLLGAGPFYWVWRTIGVDPDTAFQLWVLTVSALNFLSAYVWFARGFKLHSLGAAAGAALFAYAGMRINQTMHHQLFPHFWSIVCLFALLRLFAYDPNGRAAGGARLWLWVACLTLSLQFWVGFYLGWFLCLGLAVAALWGMLFRTHRSRIFAILRAYPYTVLLALATSVLLLAPMAIHYLEAAREVGMRSFTEALSMTPPLVAWVHFGKASWFYGWMSDMASFQHIPQEPEQRLGMGLVTTVVCVAGLCQRRREAGVRLVALSGVTLVILALNVGGITAWRFVYDLVPGAKAIRAVARIGLVILIPMGLGLAAFVDSLARKGGGRVVAAFVLGALCLLEQAETTPAFSKQQNREDIAAVAQLIEPGCQAFVFSPIQGRWRYWKYQLDAMWAGLYVGVPTLNGYSGNFPPGWPLRDTNIRFEGDERRVSAAIGFWLRRNSLDPQGICWVRAPVP